MTVYKAKDGTMIVLDDISAIGRISYDPQTNYYGYSIVLKGLPIHDGEYTTETDARDARNALIGVWKRHTAFLEVTE